jgi:hypothetical protein
MWNSENQEWKGEIHENPVRSRKSIRGSEERGYG